ncbi:MAG: hypothetical protein QG628_895, partial [Patescibacteria group bacterium]|nr:hypothetical protein [Patescibacteria group bacterium]
MFLRDVIRRSSRSLRSAKMRTILTSLAIAVGGFTLTLTLAAGNGIRDYTDRLVATNFDPAELIVGRDKEVSNSGTPNAEPKEYDESISSLTIGGNGSSLQVKQVTDNDVEQLKKLPYVEQVRKNYQLNVRYITREGQKQYTLSAEAYAPSQKPEVDAGKLPESGDLKTGTITIPNNYLKPLGFENANDAVGKTVQINYQQSAASSSVDATVAAIRNGVDPATLQPPTTTESYKIVAVTKKAATSINFGTLPVLF